MGNNIKCCPHCGSEDGYYTKDYISGSSYFYVKFDGSEADNGHMYEHLTHKRGKRAYCAECDRYIGPSDLLGEV